METTICGISAWQYARTPPALREVELDAAFARTAGLAEDLLGTRRDTREPDRLVASRLLTDLKGLTPPIHVLVDASCNGRTTRFTVPHRCDVEGLRRHRINLGNGLFVLSPEAVACHQGASVHPVLISKMMHEVCGIFSLLPQSKLLDALVRELIREGVLRPEAFRSKVFGFSDERGRPLASLAGDGRELEWAPAFDRKGKLTDIWKHAPLGSVEGLREVAEDLELSPRHPVRRAIAMTKDGAASPAEVDAHLLLCSGRANGGESWGSPHLNRVIPFTPEARLLSDRERCVGDLVWHELRSVLEVQGEAFHADEEGFRVASGRTAALENMGYSVGELLYAQMADLEMLDAVLPSLAEKLGFGLENRTPAFLKRRQTMHEHLFGIPFEQDSIRVPSRGRRRARAGAECP